MFWPWRVPVQSTPLLVVGVDRGFHQPRLDKHLLGGRIQAFDKTFHVFHVGVRGNDDQLAGAEVCQDDAAFVGQGSPHVEQDVRGAGVAELNDPGAERGQGRRISVRDPRDSAPGIFHDLQIVVGEQGIKRLLGRDILPADGDARLRHHVAVGARLAETHLRIHQVVQAGLPGQILDGVRQRHLIHDNQGNDRPALGRAIRGREGAGVCGGRGRAVSGRQGRAVGSRQGRAVSGCQGRAVSSRQGRAVGSRQGWAGGLSLRCRGIRLGQPGRTKGG